MNQPLMPIFSTLDACADKVKAIVYGYPGVGKTTLAYACQRVGKVLIVDCDSGLLSLSGDAIDAVKIRTYQDLTIFVQALNGGQFQNYDCFFVDSLTEIGKIIETNTYSKYASVDPTTGAVGLDKSIRFKYFDALKRDLEGFARLVRDQDKHVIMSALPKRWKSDATGEEGVRPDFSQGSAAESLPGLFDFIFSYRIMKDPKTGEDGRYLFTVTHQTWLAKARQKRGQPALPFYIKDPDLGQIIQHVLAQGTQQQPQTR